MPECRLVVRNRLGLHARASAKLVKLASSFPCDVFLARDDMEVNAKSIMGVLLLAASQGCELTLRTEGREADVALDAIRELIVTGFGEDD